MFLRTSRKVTACYSSAVIPEKVLTLLVILKTLSVVLMFRGEVSVSMMISVLLPEDTPKLKTVVPVVPEMLSVSQPVEVSGVVGVVVPLLASLSA